jgi:molybdopterin molybdotransferase
VAILSTGDELVSPNDTPGPGQVRDINSYTVASLVQRCGGTPLPVGIVRDEYELLLEAARNALAEADLLIFSAGSSTSTRDLTATVINTLGEPGVLVHGVSLKPGKPTILAVVDGKPAIGLPGNPVSAIVVFNLFVAPLLSWIVGLEHPPHHYTVQAKLKRNIASAPGREDHVPVHLEYENGAFYAEPLFGKSNLIYTLVRADGTVKIPLDVGGLYEGENVQVTIH